MQSLLEDRAIVADSDAIVQIKVWLLGISPMIWRRVLVPATLMLRELHGEIQVAMGWEGYHLYQFCLRARRFGSWELSASSPDVTLAALKLRKGARFVYEYDLNIPWRHEIRVEAHLPAEPDKLYPSCIGGGGSCPPEDCGGPERFLARRDDMLSLGCFRGPRHHGRDSPPSRAGRPAGGPRYRNALATRGRHRATQGACSGSRTAVFAAYRKCQSSRWRAP
jgi:Plasmid pRiA4b ORF-3-like protein